MMNMKKIFAMTAVMLSLAAFTSCSKEKLEAEDDSDIDNTYVPITLTKAERAVANNANKFAFDVYRGLYEDKQMLVSPLSLSLALSMTACGADGNTATQMSHVLGFDECSTDDVASYYHTMVTSLATIDKKTTFESANSIWIANGFPVREDFKSTAREYFAAEERLVSFKDPATVDAVNKWCSEKTHEKIPKMVDKFSPDCVMALINALYFNGRWGIDFNEKTQKEKFTTIDGNDVKVDMMSAEHLLNYSSVDGWAMVEVPYGNGAFQMEVILPPEGMAFGKAAGALDMALWNKLRSGVRAHPVDLKIPEFKFEYEAKELSDALRALGMVDAFSSCADFSKMADIANGDALYIGEVRQKAFIDVNTKGTEAAAVTIVEMSFATAIPSAPPSKVEFIADRPFFFIIREVSTDSILFIGQKVK